MLIGDLGLRGGAKTFLGDVLSGPPSTAKRAGRGGRARDLLKRAYSWLPNPGASRCSTLTAHGTFKARNGAFRRGIYSAEQSQVNRVGAKQVVQTLSFHDPHPFHLLRPNIPNPRPRQSPEKGDIAPASHPGNLLRTNTGRGKFSTGVLNIQMDFICAIRHSSHS